jgi:hypothetical protein
VPSYGALLLSVSPRVRASLEAARALGDALGACGVEHTWISRANVDADLCFFLSARHFVPSYGGFSAVVQRMRSASSGQLREANPPAWGACADELSRCLHSLHKAAVQGRAGSASAADAPRRDSPRTVRR